MQVKLLDLQAQYAPIRDEIRRAIDEVCDAQALILDQPAPIAGLLSASNAVEAILGPN